MATMTNDDQFTIHLFTSSFSQVKLKLRPFVSGCMRPRKCRTRLSRRSASLRSPKPRHGGTGDNRGHRRWRRGEGGAGKPRFLLDRFPAATAQNAAVMRRVVVPSRLAILPGNVSARCAAQDVRSGRAGVSRCRFCSKRWRTLQATIRGAEEGGGGR